MGVAHGQCHGKPRFLTNKSALQRDGHEAPNNSIVPTKAAYLEAQPAYSQYRSDLTMVETWLHICADRDVEGKILPNLGAGLLPAEPDGNREGFRAWVNGNRSEYNDVGEATHFVLLLESEQDNTHCRYTPDLPYVIKCANRAFRVGKIYQ